MRAETGEVSSSEASRGSPACVPTLPRLLCPTATSPWQRVAPACTGPGESGRDGGDLCAFRLAHYVGNEVKQPGGAFVLRGLPLSCQTSVYL